MSLGLAIGLVALAALGVALLLLPLLARQHRPAPRDAYNLAVYRDQLAEIERDTARGLLTAEQAEAARSEIGRRILALDPAETAPAPSRRPLAAAIAAVLLLPVAALLIYVRLGSPSLPDQPFAERARDRAEPVVAEAANAEMEQALANLRAHLKQRPDDVTGWALLGRAELGLGRFAEAVEAYRQAAEMSGNRPDIAGDFGEAQVLAAGGTVTNAARRAFEAALKDAESAPRARYYLALARLQQGDATGALEAWRALAADAPADAEWLPLVRQKIAQAAAVAAAKPEPAGGMPSQETVTAAAQAAAGASAEERRAMIDAMVERLATRLEEQPDDAEGWARLGHSYMVLERPDKARQAYARAVKLRPDDAALQQALTAAAAAAVEAGNNPAAPRR